jgi:hypothetical protein
VRLRCMFIQWTQTFSHAHSYCAQNSYRMHLST